MRVLIEADELAALLDDVTLLDVRWKLGGPPGHGEYLQGHIPGAVYVDLDTELAAHGAPTDGRHPLPSLEALQASARRWGVRAGRPVVAYDATGNTAAARAWWLLRWAGVPDVRLLDGGLAAWSGELATDDVVPEPGDIELRGGALPLVELDDVPKLAERGVLLDARAGERYRGEVEPIDPRAGHIPGARSAPTTENLAPDGRFLAPDALRERFAALGADGSRLVGVYCGSGVTAAHEIAALAIAGVDAALYPGSFSQWSNHEHLPVATA
ncbi:sulfurtransferase [Solirubrobacter sp. CPCC 204708]|uniref:Sulfurtransferase n=1 Tax=Solirubrobacter deserti TaxID=2282478 RepID=A0ABT4RSM7_9ACTN|nr:sulfurtransferase [Solirubrobacter deserti]MBE2315918.1 sulfurtransferase [Solirubrobacter deserti]MDA0141597.1 sulfurtransferase [Solirubrobacter deserti]